MSKKSIYFYLLSIKMNEEEKVDANLDTESYFARTRRIARKMTSDKIILINLQRLRTSMVQNRMDRMYYIEKMEKILENLNQSYNIRLNPNEVIKKKDKIKGLNIDESIKNELISLSDQFKLIAKSERSLIISIYSVISDIIYYSNRIVLVHSLHPYPSNPFTFYYIRQAQQAFNIDELLEVVDVIFAHNVLVENKVSKEIVKTALNLSLNMLITQIILVFYAIVSYMYPWLTKYTDEYVGKPSNVFVQSWKVFCRDLADNLSLAPMSELINAVTIISSPAIEEAKKFITEKLSDAGSSVIYYATMGLVNYLENDNSKSNPQAVKNDIGNAVIEAVNNLEDEAVKAVVTFEVLAKSEGFIELDKRLSNITTYNDLLDQVKNETNTDLSLKSLARHITNPNGISLINSTRYVQQYIQQMNIGNSIYNNITHVLKSVNITIDSPLEMSIANFASSINKDIFVISNNYITQANKAIYNAINVVAPYKGLEFPDAYVRYYMTKPSIFGGIEVYNPKINPLNYTFSDDQYQNIISNRPLLGQGRNETMFEDFIPDIDYSKYNKNYDIYRLGPKWQDTFILIFTLLQFFMTILYRNGFFRKRGSEQIELLDETDLLSEELGNLKVNN